MNDRLHKLLYRNLQEVFGEGDAERRGHQGTLYRRLRALRTYGYVRRARRAR